MERKADEKEGTAETAETAEKSVLCDLSVFRGFSGPLRTES
jgi:hypothetical protein